MALFLFYAIKGNKRERVEVCARDFEEACEKMEQYIERHGYESCVTRSSDEW